jgi:hypothetical protein
VSVALVIGSAQGVWRDVEHALWLVDELGGFRRIYCVNQSGIDCQAMDAWVTLHPELLSGFEEERERNGFKKNYETVAPLSDELGYHAKKGKIDRRVSYKWPKMIESSSSGIYAAKVAIEDGFSVVLAGVPMMPIPHYRTGKVWNDCTSFYERAFRQTIPYLKGKVKSMSGYTRETLGDPTPEWLAGASS